MIVTVKKHFAEVSWGAKDSKGNVKPQYDNTATKWVPGLNKKTGQLRTGLKNGQEEARFEKELGLEKGSLRASGSFWDTFFVIIPEDGLELDLSVPMNELQYMTLKADPTIATTEKESKMAGMEFIMTSASDDAKAKNNERDVIMKAFSKFATMSQDEVIDALYMLGEYPKSTDPEICRNALGDIVENNPAKFVSHVVDPFFSDKVWLIKLTRKGIVQKDGVGKGFNLPLRFNDVMLGESIDAAVAYLKAPENQNILIGLKKAEEAINKGE